jgi:hypothetical protein
MDPIIMYQLGRIRQQEILEQAAKDYGAKPLRQYVSDFGNLLIHVGQRMVDAASPALEPQTVPAQNPVENCG